MMRARLGRMTRSLAPKAERRGGISDAIIFNILMFVLSLIAGAILQLVIASHRPGATLSDNVGEGVLNVFVMFAALEVGKLIVDAERLKSLVERQDHAIRRFISHDRDIRGAQRKFDFVISHYLQRDAPAHEAVAKALLDMVGHIKVDEDYLQVIGDQLAVASYRWFWTKVTEAQIRNAEAGNKAPITVFATHSAPISFWLKQEFVPIRHVQHRFVEAGGILNRIIVDRSGKEELLATYAKVIREMRHKRRAPFVEDRYLLVGETAEENGGQEAEGADRSDTGRNIFYLQRDEDDTVLDFMITYFDGQYYSCEWTPHHITSSNADIASCDLHVGRKEFEEKYCEKWRYAVDALVEDNPDWGAGLAAMQISDDDRQVLMSRPDDRALSEMLRLPL
jgi:hypothetical protein